MSWSDDVAPLLIDLADVQAKLAAHIAKHGGKKEVPADVRAFGAGLFRRKEGILSELVRHGAVLANARRREGANK